MCVCVCVAFTRQGQFCVTTRKDPCALLALVTAPSATVRSDCAADGVTSHETDYGEEMEGPLLLHS